MIDLRYNCLCFLGSLDDLSRGIRSLLGSIPGSLKKPSYIE